MEIYYILAWCNSLYIPFSKKFSNGFIFENFENGQTFLTIFYEIAR